MRIAEWGICRGALLRARREFEGSLLVLRLGPFHFQETGFVFFQPGPRNQHSVPGTQEGVARSYRNFLFYPPPPAPPTGGGEEFGIGPIPSPLRARGSSEPEALRGEAVKKLEYSPSPYPLPRGERVNILKYKKKFPPPRRGRGRVGVIITCFKFL